MENHCLTVHFLDMDHARKTAGRTWLADVELGLHALVDMAQASCLGWEEVADRTWREQAGRPTCSRRHCVKAQGIATCAAGAGGGAAAAVVVVVVAAAVAAVDDVFAAEQQSKLSSTASAAALSRRIFHIHLGTRTQSPSTRPRSAHPTLEAGM